MFVTSHSTVSFSNHTISEWSSTNSPLFGMHHAFNFFGIPAIWMLFDQSNDLQRSADGQVSQCFILPRYYMQAAVEASSDCAISCPIITIH